MLFCRNLPSTLMWLNQWSVGKRPDQWERASFDSPQPRNCLTDFDKIRISELSPEDQPPCKISFERTMCVVSANTQHDWKDTISWVHVSPGSTDTLVTRWVPYFCSFHVQICKRTGATHWLYYVHVNSLTLHWYLCANCVQWTQQRETRGGWHSTAKRLRSSFLRWKVQLAAVVSMVGVTLFHGQHLVSIWRTVLRLDLRIVEIPSFQSQSNVICRRYRRQI